MSQAEIERYLAELQAVWPDDPLRNAALDELRDHLLAISEDDSIPSDQRAAEMQRVLQELGDAGQLAMKLRGESLQDHTRWIMRISTAAAVLGIVTLLGIASFWPGKAVTPLVNVAQAQAPAPAVSKTSPVVNQTEANNQVTQEKLTKRIAADFADIPFGEAIALIGDRAEVETYINRRALSEAGIELSATVSMNLKQVRADMLLDLILQQVSSDQIDYVVQDGLVVITSVASLDGANEVKAYPVADLLKLHRSELKTGAGEGASIPGGAPMGPGGFGGDPFGDKVGGAAPSLGTAELPPNVQQLVQVLQNTVSPDSWSEVGGHGTVTYFGDMLVIRQNARTHREIAKVLALLRETAAKSSAK